ncbi:Abi family protein [Mycoplasma elephantis]|uniref:Abi family protein n=1 Tax=Mycoplasma elephantis TaxID=114882 RepID=UPI00048A256F|nr:Abi family protein [Mycoplasma elephantis]
MKNKPFLSIDEQIELLEQRNLKFSSESEKNKFKLYLKMYGYQNFVNGYNDFFFVNEDRKMRKYKSNARPSNIISLFNFDRGISNFILSNIQNVERKISSLIIYAMNKWVNENGFFDRFKNGKILDINNKDWNLLFPYDSSLSLRKEIIDKLWILRYNNLILKYKDNLKMCPIWIFMILMSFGTIIDIYKKINDDIKFIILKNINVYSSKYFLSILVILKETRNRICHNNVLYNIKKKIVVNGSKNIKIRLFDIVNILDALNNKNRNGLEFQSLRFIFIQKINKYINNDSFDTEISAKILNYIHYKNKNEGQ